MPVRESEEDGDGEDRRRSCYMGAVGRQDLWKILLTQGMEAQFQMPGQEGLWEGHAFSFGENE